MANQTRCHVENNLGKFLYLGHHQANHQTSSCTPIQNKGVAYPPKLRDREHYTIDSNRQEHQYQPPFSRSQQETKRTKNKGCGKINIGLQPTTHRRANTNSQTLMLLCP